MRPADTWKDYELLDATDGNRLERWGETLLIRPDPQVVWKTPKQSPLWAKADAIYHRSNQGGGEWEYRRDKCNPERFILNSYQPVNFFHDYSLLSSLSAILQSHVSFL